jgi:hypothetical protein
MNNIIMLPADASPEDHAAFLQELASLHPNVAEALSIISMTRYKQGKEDVYRIIRRLERNIEILRAGPDWKQGARWALEKITQQ